MSIIASIQIGAIWGRLGYGQTNLGFTPKTCKKDCPNMEGTKHKLNIGHLSFIKDGDNVISLSSKSLREKYKNFEKSKEEGYH